MLRGILEKATYKGWRWNWCRCATGDVPLGATGWLVWATFKGECADTGVQLPQNTRKWYVSPWSVTSEVVRTLFLCVLVAEEHETRECFRYNGKQILGPHIAVAALEGVANDKVARQGSGPRQD